MIHSLLPYGVVTQLLGFIAIGFSVAVFQLNRRHLMLILQMLARLLWAAHFFLLGAVTGSAMGLLGAFQSFAYYKAGNKRDAHIPILSALSFVAATVFTWQGPRSLLPLGGALIGVLAFWQINPRHIRLLALPGSGCWFIYSVLSGSYAGMTADILVLFSTLIGIYRFDIKRRSKNRKLYSKKRPKLA